MNICWYTAAALCFAVAALIILRLDVSPRHERRVSFSDSELGAPTGRVEHARAQLPHAVALAAKQDQIVWTIFGIFWTANAVLLVELFTSGQLPMRAAAIAISAFGSVLSLLWSVIQFRSVAGFRYYEAIIQRLESADFLDVPRAIALSRRLNDLKRRGFKVRGLMVACPVFSTVAWLFFLAFVILER